MGKSNTSPVVLITGCNSGIGEQLALAFATRGFMVVATARSVESLSHLTSQHDNIVALRLELGDLESLERFRDTVSEHTGGRLDILVNSAGTHYAATAMDLEVDAAAQLFSINLFAVMRLCQLFVPLLRNAPQGRIVQIGSVTRDVPVVWQCVYNASKAALSQYTKTLRLELKPLGIEVIEVVTGFVRSNILQHGLYAPSDSLYFPIKSTVEQVKYQGNKNGMPPEAYARSIVNQLLQRRTSPEIWEGKLAWWLRFLVTFCPLWLLNWIVSRQFQLHLLESL
ncbi:hypothetical protein B0J13DRAFT_449237 [Dactylonectria estremocensis]|uniref:NADPH-dependent 1-acyldihydroxyacetone phosphate reductase n=1 Tax=Dactylonectria estremocensis TaxID=1079267 RepID=A0A9P9J093_9HYPO|nr:hypothetical protein B0J13DRAFT_449237 [Dactylonectria estremocensis]